MYETYTKRRTNEAMRVWLECRRVAHYREDHKRRKARRRGAEFKLGEKKSGNQIFRNIAVQQQQQKIYPARSSQKACLFGAAVLLLMSNSQHDTRWPAHSGAQMLSSQCTSYSEHILGVLRFFAALFMGRCWWAGLGLVSSGPAGPARRISF